MPRHLTNLRESCFLCCCDLWPVAPYHQRAMPWTTTQTYMNHPTLALGTEIAPLCAPQIYFP